MDSANRVIIIFEDFLLTRNWHRFTLLQFIELQQKICKIGFKGHRDDKWMAAADRFLVSMERGRLILPSGRRITKE